MFENAMNLTDGELVTFRGKPMLFTNLRVDRKTIPDGYFAYDVRHDDSGEGIPVEIARFVLVNHLGTVITDEELDLGDDGYLFIEEDEWNYEGLSISMTDYMEGKYASVQDCMLS